MAEEEDKESKTEEPTERRIEKAIERGDVPKSAEMAVLLSLGVSILCLMIGGALGGNGLVSAFASFLSRMHSVPVDGLGLRMLAMQGSVLMLQILALPFVLALIAGVAAGLIAHRPIFTSEPLMPKLNRLSPIAGFKRLFGREALIQFVKSLLKFAIVGAVMLIVLWPERGKLAMLATIAPGEMLEVAARTSLKLLAGVFAVFTVVAIADLLYQRFAWRERLKMSREELKQEYKETEGNPEVKAKLKRLRNEVLRRRMMAAVPKASVVITNPTHFAVALKYERGMNAPVLVAKGVDSLALKIREVAAAHEVPIVENPPLARALHAAIDIDDEIPEDHYRAVAEVIGYVMKLRRQRGVG